MNEKANCPKEKNRWGGKRECAGRKKTCKRKVPFNRRVNEDILIFCGTIRQSTALRKPKLWRAQLFYRAISTN